jgi:hypothetical protein
LDGGDVVGVDSGSGHDADTAGRLFNEGGDERRALEGGRLLAGGEDTVATGGNECLKGSKGVAASIEGAMKGKGERAGGIFETQEEFGINVTLFGETAGSDAVKTYLSAKTDISEHGKNFGMGIKEITGTGADDGVET